MSGQTPGSAAAPLSLPESPDLDWLRMEAKRRLAELRRQNPNTQPADAQLDLAKQYGFQSWGELEAHIIEPAASRGRRLGLYVENWAAESVGGRWRGVAGLSDSKLFDRARDENR